LRTTGADPSPEVGRPGERWCAVQLGSVVERNNVTVTGDPDGPVLLLAHGFGCDQEMWQRLVPFFAADHRIVAFDHVGAGGSDLSSYDSARYATLEGYADDVRQICAELDLHDVTFVGHSVSAMVGVLAAVAEPGRFRDLVLIAPSPSFIDEPETGYVGGFSRADIDELLGSMDANYTAWAQAIAPMVMGNADRPELGAELEGRFCRTDPDIAREFARVTFTTDARHVLSRVRTRTLVLQCRDDALAPLSVGAYVGEHVPDCTVVQLAATGHCPHVSAPEETAAAIRAHRDRAR
jgi:sigma-B regulation protein RsbQ